MTGRAWPFLIARGRRRGYSALLVPGFLREHGFLETTATPLGNVPSRAAATPQGVLVWAEHTVTAAEARGEPRDEYGRPLVLLHGFLCPDGDPTTGAAALTWTRTTALAVYDRFLADEDGFRVERSEPFEIEIAEVVRLWVSPPAAPAAPVRPARGLAWAWAGAGVLVVAAAVAVAVAFASSGNDAPPVCATDVVTPSVAPTISAATCVRGGTTVTYSPLRPKNK